MIPDILVAIEAALASPSGIVITGYTLALIIRAYVSDREIFDFDVEFFGVDIDLDIDTDYGLPILKEFTLTEQAVILLSLYYQYAVVTPETGLQSLLTDVSSLILFGIFMDFIVNHYLVDQDD